MTELPISAWSSMPTAQVVPESLAIDPDEDVDQQLADARIAANAAAVARKTGPAQTTLFYRRLQPRSHELTVRIVVSNRLVRSILQHPELAWSLKQDIAYALARRADGGFLHGDPRTLPSPARFAASETRGAPFRSRARTSTSCKPPGRWSPGFAPAGGSASTTQGGSCTPARSTR